MRTCTGTTSFAVSVAAVLVGLIPSALAAPSRVSLHLDGTHPLNDFHRGTFTATEPICATGSWQGHGDGTRTFTCADGTGTFLALFTGALEHVAGSTSPWSIIRGTGRYAALRGKGDGHVDTSEGSDDSTGPRPTFSDTWTGMVDFDTTAPTGSITQVKVVHPRTPKATWTVKVRLRAHDDVAQNSVTFLASVTANPFFAIRSGKVTNGSTSLLFRFYPARRTRTIEVEIELADPWDNKRTLRKAVPLR